MDKFCSGSGKSASFFFFCENNKYILKTLIGVELKNLTQNLIKEYHPHILEHPDSALIRFYGAFTLKIKYPFRVNI